MHALRSPAPRAPLLTSGTRYLIGGFVQLMMGHLSVAKGDLVGNLLINQYFQFSLTPRSSFTSPESYSYKWASRPGKPNRHGTGPKVQFFEREQLATNTGIYPNFYLIWNQLCLYSAARCPVLMTFHGRSLKARLNI